MLAKQTAAPGRISVRYYVCSSGGLQRITQRLHRDLFDRAVALPQYAGSKQKVLEVLIKRLTGTHYSITARGIVYPFDAGGFLDMKAKAGKGPIEISRFRSAQTNVVDLNPSIKRRRFRQEYTWEPSKKMLDAVWADVEPRRAKRHRRLPLLRPSSGAG